MLKKEPEKTMSENSDHPHFTEDFPSFVSEGSKITCETDGFLVTATVWDDPHHGPPWETEDGHGPVSQWTSRDAEEGERILSGDRHGYRYYDFDEAVRIAVRDKWGCIKEGITDPHERAVQAAEEDYSFLKAWCNDEWSYIGVSVTVERCGVTLVDNFEKSLWGIGANQGQNGYLTEVAEELIPEALESATRKLHELSNPVAGSGTAPEAAPDIAGFIGFDIRNSEVLANLHGGFSADELRRIADYLELKRDVEISVPGI